MLVVINILVIFFIILIVYQILDATRLSVVEGLTTTVASGNTASTTQYQPYDMNNPNNALILAQQNAGNIQVLKQQLDGLMSLNDEVQDISGNVVALQAQVNGIVSAQQNYAQQMAPSTPPTITGVTSSSS